MPIDPLLRLITFFGDTDQLVVGVSKRLKNLLRYSVPTLGLAGARVFDVQLVLHGAILAWAQTGPSGLNALLSRIRVKRTLKAA